MLQDTLVQWCQEEYDRSSAEYCGRDCDNKGNCNHTTAMIAWTKFIGIRNMVAAVTIHVPICCSDMLFDLRRSIHNKSIMP